MKGLILCSFFAALLSAPIFGDEAPQFPFSDWSKIQEGSTVFSGGEGDCGPGQTHPAVGYYIERKDGAWRLFAPTNPDESNRWVGYSVDQNAMPHWVYFGVTQGNQMTFKKVVPYNRKKHSNACPLIFPSS